jgi:signal transduction histidine kinase
VRVRRDASPPPHQGRFDEEQMRQVLLNLCLNSIEAMPSGGDLVLKAGPTGDGGTWIEVVDTGGGIPETVFPHIFEPFYTTKSGGTGLGLAIAHRIVEKHEGRLEIRSVPGTGTTVRIRIPAMEAADATEAAPVARAA